MKNQIVFLRHIIDSISRIESYVKDVSESDFLNNFMIQDAVIRNLEIIGEATKKLSVELRKSNPTIPWKQIAGMRDKLIHEYFGVDLPSVWIVATEDIPVLKEKLIDLMTKVNQSPEL